jgi:cellulose synthase operon protein C
VRTLPLLRAAAAALAVSLATPVASAFVWPNVPEQVARGLASSEVSERRLAAQRIIELPRETAHKLATQAMGDPDGEVRIRAAQAAIAHRLPKAGDLVASWLSEPDARVRLAACDVIRAAPTSRSVTALARVLGDPDPRVRLAAAAAMGSSGEASAVSPLLGHLDDPSSEVREEVARALGRIGDARAVVPLVGKVQDSIPEVRRVVARALGDLGDARAASALMLALGDASAEVRLEAVTALGKLRSDEAVSVIAPFAEGTSQSGMVIAGGRRQQSGVGVHEVRVAALRALGQIGSDAAVKSLVKSLAKDDPAAARSPVRDALAAAGKRATPALVALLSGSPSSKVAAGAARALGALHAKPGVPAILRAMQRGIVPLRHGLRALADLGAPSALPSVLEMLDDADPLARKEAIRAAITLLDPAHVDGRPVDPARASLADPRTPIDERVELCKLLGRTGSPRAEGALLPLTQSKVTSLRLAAIEALGALRGGSPAIDKALLAALDDESPDVRFRSAASLARVGGAAAAPLLLERLTVAAEQDRGALGLAMSGALARSTDAALAARVKEAIPSAPDAARDALIEGLGRMRGPAARQQLEALVGGSIDDRRKVAEALAGHPDAAPALLKLAADPDPGVRANAVWSLGAVATKDHLGALASLISDPDAAVAANAAGALGLASARVKDDGKAAPLLCQALRDARPYVRSNALEALSLVGAPCEGHVARDLLARDPSEPVRIAAADSLARAIARAGNKADPADRRALVRCVSEERDATVATRCSRPLSPKEGKDDVAVYVVPDGRNTPVARAPYTLVRADGLLRMGIADRRGELFEVGAPRGVIRLGVPAALVR